MSLTVTLSESGGFDLHEPEEWLDGLLVAIEETEGTFGPGLKWIIELDDDEPAENGEARETWAFCSQKFSPRSKLYSWIKAIDPGLIPEPGEVLDLEEVIGTRVQVMFERYMGDIDGEPVEKEKVVKIRAAKKTKKAAKSRRKVETADSEDSADSAATPY